MARTRTTRRLGDGQRAAKGFVSPSHGSVRGLLQIAADIGGTFTDIAFITSGRVVVSRKVASTPTDFATAVIEGVRDILGSRGLSLARLAELRHASTIATNTILEHKGAPTALVTTAGFRDVLELRRVRVPVLYDPHYLTPKPLVPRRRRFEVRERIGPRGEVITPLDEDEVCALAEQIAATNVEAVAVCLIHSYANPAHERHLGKILARKLGERFVTLSSDVLPEMREYERTSTTVINAYVGPIVSRYLASLVNRLSSEGFRGRTLIMQSSGGMLAAPVVVNKPAQIVECGPAGGVIGAATVCRQAGYGDAITLDIGGTTAKACLIEGGKFTKTTDYEVSGALSSTSHMFKGKGYALKFPVINICEVGAGGGSIARVDSQGVLKVGPESAGAVPGPVCYGKGGDAPTLTDANLVLGYLNPCALAGGTVPVDAGRSHAAIAGEIAPLLRQGVFESAYGIHIVANANMMRAIKSVSTYRGRDPRDFTLFAFGGNGGVHAVGLATSLGMRRIVIPPAAGVFSAVGMLYAPVELELSRAFARRLDASAMRTLIDAFEDLHRAVARSLEYPVRSIAFARFVDLRYRGQAYELTIAADGSSPSDVSGRRLAEKFAQEHERSYGYRLGRDAELEIVAVRVRGTVKARRRISLATVAAGGSGETSRMDHRRCYFGPRLGLRRTALLSRSTLARRGKPGPFIIEEYDSTIVVPPGWRARLDAHGNVVIESRDAAG